MAQGVCDSIDDINPKLPVIRNMPLFPQFRVLKVMQDLYHQHFDSGSWYLSGPVSQAA